MLIPRKPLPGPLPRTKVLHGERRSWEPFGPVMICLILVLAGSVAVVSVLSLGGTTSSPPESAGTIIHDELPALPVQNEPVGTWRADALGPYAQFATAA